MTSPTVTSVALDAAKVTPHIARLVLGHFRSGDHTLWTNWPSSGEKAALDLACAIDERLLDSLSNGFPGLVTAVRMARGRGGVPELEAIARGES